MTQIAICREETVESSPLLSYGKTGVPKSSVSIRPSIESGLYHKFGRMNLVISSLPNVGCNYCDSETNSKTNIATAQEAIEQVKSALESDPHLREVEISGSGDALATDVTFELLDILQEEFPHLSRRIVTNGLLLPKRLALLEDYGVGAVKIAVNAVNGDVGSKIYSFVRLNGKTLHGPEAFEVLSINQLEGLRCAADDGLTVEVNATCIPGVNVGHLVEVAKIVRSLGAYKLNIERLNPSGRHGDLRVLSASELKRIRRKCEDVCASEVHLCTSPSLGCAFVGL